MSLNIAGMKRTEIVSTFRIIDYMDTIQMIELERMFPLMSKTTSEVKISDLNCRRSLYFLLFFLPLDYHPVLCLEFKGVRNQFLGDL